MGSTRTPSATPYFENVAVVRMADASGDSLLSICGGIAGPISATDLWQFSHPSQHVLNAVLAEFNRSPIVESAGTLQKMSIAVSPKRH